MKRLFVVLALASLAVGACGKRGTLERPPPLWGGGDNNAPVANIPNPATLNTSIRQAPVGQTPSDPYRGPGEPGPAIQPGRDVPPPPVVTPAPTTPMTAPQPEGGGASTR